MPGQDDGSEHSRVRDYIRGSVTCDDAPERVPEKSKKRLVQKQKQKTRVFPVAFEANTATKATGNTATDGDWSYDLYTI